MLSHPEYWVYDKEGKPLYIQGDHSFDPPKQGMLVFNHGRSDVRGFWRGVCEKAVFECVFVWCVLGAYETCLHVTGSLNDVGNACLWALRICVCLCEIYGNYSLLCSPY